MSIRRRAITPDTYIDTETYGRIPFVSDQSFLEAVLAAAQTQALAGGVLSVIVDRHPTDLPEESVTIRAIVEWRNRTDARPQREPVAEPPKASIVEDVHEEEPVETEAVPEDEEPPAAEDDPPDGIRYEDLEEEDLSAIPAEMR